MTQRHSPTGVLRHFHAGGHKPLPEAPEPEEPLPPPRCPHCDLPMERRERTWRPLPDIVTLSPTYARGPPAAS